MGEFKDGEINGHGTFNYADGGVYEGEWRMVCNHLSILENGLITILMVTAPRKSLIEVFILVNGANVILQRMTTCAASVLMDSVEAEIG